MSDVTNGRAKAQMKVWRPQGFAGVEVERFDNLYRLSLPKRYMVEYEFTLSMRIEGHVRLHYQGEKHVTSSHDALLFMQHPGETLSGEVRTRRPHSAWTLRLYQEHFPSLLDDLGLEQREVFLPSMFSHESLNTPLCALLSELILCFERPAAHLERETRLLGFLYAVLKHCSDTPPPEMKLGKEHKAVSLVKEVLQTHPEQDHTLDNLSLLTSLNKYYLWEVFKRDVGLSPDQYQTCLRIHKAKDLLAKGTPIVKTALDTGFSDQSHLTRVFKKYTQVTPGKFKKDTLSS